MPIEEEYPKVERQTMKRSKQLQKEFMKDWLAENQEEFAEVMKDLRTRDARTWAKYYIESMKFVVPKTSVLDIKHGISKDFEKLMMLGKSTSKEAKQEVFAEYEEVKEPELPVREQSILDSKTMMERLMPKKNDDTRERLQIDNPSY